MTFTHTQADHRQHGTMAEQEQKSGWGWPLASKKAHYFIGLRSLCGGWAYGGELETGNDDSADNCRQCVKRLKAMRQPTPASSASPRRVTSDQ